MFRQFSGLYSAAKLKISYCLSVKKYWQLLHQLATIGGQDIGQSILVDSPPSSKTAMMQILA